MTISWCGAPRSRSSGGSDAKKRCSGVGSTAASKQRVQLVVERPEPFIAATYCETRVRSTGRSSRVRRTRSRAARRARPRRRGRAPARAGPRACAFTISTSLVRRGPARVGASSPASWRRIAAVELAAARGRARSRARRRSGRAQPGTPRAPPPAGPSGRARASAARGSARAADARATSASSSPTTSAWRPSSSSASIRSSSATSRSSSSRRISGLREVVEARTRRAPGRARARARAAAASRRSAAGSRRASASARSKRLRVDLLGRDAQDVAGRRVSSASAPSALRSCETSSGATSCAVFGGVLAPEQVDESIGRDDAARRRAARIASSARCLWPPSASGPVSSETSSGPRIRNSSVTCDLRPSGGLCPASAHRSPERAQDPLKSRVSELLVRRCRPVGGPSDRAGHDSFIRIVSLRTRLPIAAVVVLRRSPLRSARRRRPRRPRCDRVAPPHQAVGRAQAGMPRAPRREPSPTRTRWPVKPFRSSTPSAASSATRASRTTASRASSTSASTSRRRTGRRSTRRSRAPSTSTRCMTTTIEIVGRGRHRVQLLARRSERPRRPARHRLPDRDRPHRGAVRPRALLGGARRPLPQSAAPRRARPVSSTTRRPTDALGRGVAPAALVAETYDETPLAVPRPWYDLPVMPALVRWRLLDAQRPRRHRLEHGGRLPAHDPTCVRVRRVWAPGTTQNHVRAARPLPPRPHALAADLRAGRYLVEVARVATRAATRRAPRLPARLERLLERRRGPCRRVGASANAEAHGGGRPLPRGGRSLPLLACEPTWRPELLRRSPCRHPTAHAHGCSASDIHLR